MSDIPSDVSREILKRVSVESLFRLRSVCKSWRRIIDDPFFLTAHFPRPTGPEQLIITSITGELYSLSLDSLDSSGKVLPLYDSCGNLLSWNFLHDKFVEAKSIRSLVCRGVPRIFDFPMPSCDGLMLVPASKKSKAWLLWNPFNGESTELPLCNDFTDLVGGDMPCSGIGFDSVSNDYKIVRVAPGPDDLTGVGLVTFVYSLNSNAWCRIEDVKGCVIWDHCGVFAYGALHFVAYEYEDEFVRWRWALALDLATETYRKLPLPSRLPDVDECSLEIGASGKYMFLSCSWNKECVVDRFDVWIVKDYGGERMWIKMLTLRSEVNACPVLNYRVITYKNGKVLIQENYKDFLWHNWKSYKGAKIFNIDGIPDRFTSQVFPASLIRFSRSDPAVDEVVVSKGTSNKKRKRANERLEM